VLFIYRTSTTWPGLVIVLRGVAGLFLVPKRELKTCRDAAALSKATSRAVLPAADAGLDQPDGSRRCRFLSGEVEHRSGPSSASELTIVRLIPA